MVIKNYPEEYYESVRNKTNEPSYHYLACVANSIDNRQAEIADMDTFMSPLECPSGLIPYIADAIAVGVDAYEPVDFQRTITNNAVQYYKLKGTKDAYKIRGLMSGFDVTVVNLWYVAPYIADMLGPAQKLEVPPGSGIWMSKLSPTEVSGVSGEIPYYGNCDFCLTAYVGVIFEMVKVPPTGFPLNILDRIIEKIKEIMPIHVRELYIELEFKIDVDMAMDSQEHFGTEESYRTVGMNYRFDLWPSDVVPTDVGLNVRGVASAS